MKATVRFFIASFFFVAAAAFAENRHPYGDDMLWVPEPDEPVTDIRIVSADQRNVGILPGEDKPIFIMRPDMNGDIEVPADSSFLKSDKNGSKVTLRLRIKNGKAVKLFDPKSKRSYKLVPEKSASSKSEY